MALSDFSGENCLEIIGIGLGKQILDTPDFSDLILHSLEKINNANTPIQVFLIEIVTVLFKNELQFSKMQMQGFRKLFSEFCIHVNLSLPCPRSPPGILHLACIHLATTEITHCSGLAIILENKVWQKVLYRTIHKKPKQISNAAYEFMAKLVWKLNEYNKEAELLEVLGFIVEPILTSGYLNVEVLDAETETVLTDKIFAYLRALYAVLEEADSYAPVNKVMTLLKEYFIVDHRLFKILHVTKNPNLLKLLNSCLFRFFFQVFRHLLYDKKTNDFANKMTACHRNYLAHSVRKREPFAIIDFAIQSNLIWSHFEKSHATEFDFPLMFERNGLKIDFSVQLLVHLLVPMVTCVRLHRISNKLAMTDAIEEFFAKLGRTITDYMYTSAYMFGEILADVCTSLRKKVTTHTLKELLRLKGHINESQAGLLFQSLYYVLQIFIVSDGAGGLVLNENHMDPDDLRLLSHMLNVFKMLLVDHCIHWHENLEVINIQADLLNLLKQSFLTAMLKVQVIDLINICVRRFLSPNMSLLVEDKRTQGNTLNEIGEVIQLYAEHEDWEVRDSALSLLYSCTEICFIKYIPLQKIIRDKSLMKIAAKMALTDLQFYSQSAALKCLAPATKMNCIWQEVLAANPQISLQLVHIVRNHAEGMVRKEAVNVLTELYGNQKIAPSFQNTLYEIMMMAALDDLYWEVQLAALSFWKSAIQRQLTDRGMLDGKFPSVTFSKEKRKIIVLNDAEIHKQLIGIMHQLSRIGCLTVLLGCMDEIHNVEVMDRAHRIAKEFIEILDKYKLININTMDGIETQSAQVRSKYEKSDIKIPTESTYIASEEERDKVIDDILNVDLSDLIVNIYDNYNQIKSEEMDIDYTLCSRRELVQPDKFLETFRNNDYSKIIEDKSNCNPDFSTLERLLDTLLDSELIT